MTCCVNLALARLALATPYELEAQESAEELSRVSEEESLLAVEDEAHVEPWPQEVDLATASREELYTLPGLTWAQVDALLEYREQAGGLGEPAELVAAGLLTAEQL